MTRSVYGELCSPDGVAAAQELVQGSNGVELRQRSWATPAAEIRSVQARWIGIDRDHDGRWFGEIIHLERRHGRIFAVGKIDDDAPLTTAVKVGDKVVNVETPLYFSIERTHHGEGFTDIEINGVGIVASTARLSARPITIRDGNAHAAGYLSTDHQAKELLKRAADTDRRRHGGPLVVLDLDRQARWARIEGRHDECAVGERLALLDEERYARRPAGPIEHGPHGRIISVR